MSNIIKDKLPLISMCSPEEIEIAKRANIPLFRGILSELIEDEYGNVILKREVSRNTVVVGGAIAALEKLTGATANWKPATLNSIYSLNTGVPYDDQKATIALFGVGIGGCGLDFASVKAKDIKARNVPDLIPLRVGESLSGVDAGRYYFKKPNDDGSYYWYLKELPSLPVIKTCWKDSVDPDGTGTEVTTEIYDSTRTEGLETFAEFIIDFNEYDVREYFEFIGELDMARYNSIGLFTGQKVDVGGGEIDYVNVRLFSYTNMDNKSVVNKTTSRYSYQLYSLV